MQFSGCQNHRFALVLPPLIAVVRFYKTLFTKGADMNTRIKIDLNQE